MRASRRPRVLVVAACAAAVAACTACGASGAASTPGGRLPDVLLPIDSMTIEARVPRNATLERLLEEHDFPTDVALAAVDAIREVFNPRRLRVDQRYRITRSLDGIFREFRYDIDADHFLRLVFRSDAPTPAFEAEVVPYPKEIVPSAVETAISYEHPSLIAALAAGGENQLLALQVAELFGGEVDFNSELQDGDTLQVLFGRAVREGEFVGYDERPGLAVLENGGVRHTAMTVPQDDGTIAGYDWEGHSLKRRFLRSPLGFQTSISSGFSYRRLHPVLGTFRAHPAIDYRAPYGAEVIAVAAGTVTFAAPSGASGRLVTIKHAGGYESLYLHLSGFGPGIRPGARVEQGQVIGRVGNSGMVTATHLDYRLKKNGTYVNPLVEHSKMPPGDPIPDDRMPEFLAERDRRIAELDRLLHTEPSSLAALR